MKLREAILSLLIDGPIVGITRLQKLLFLIEKEGKIVLDASFEPYRFGPFSKKVQDDIDFLINMGYIESSVDNTSLARERDINEVYKMPASSFLSSSIPRKQKELSELESDETEREINEQTEEPIVSKDNVVYRLTEKGKIYLENLPFSLQPIRKIKNKYCNLSLSDLLSYVYSHYPKYTIESEIRDRYL